MGMTCATPAMAMRRGRSTQSAYSRTCMALRAGALPVEALPAAGSEAGGGPMGMAICRISPITELMGPMRGTTPGGRPSSMAVRRSDTICRAR